MTTQVQPSPTLPKPILMRSRPKKVFFLDDVTEKIGSSRQALLLQEQARAQASKERTHKMTLNGSFDNEVSSDTYDYTYPTYNVPLNDVSQPQEQQSFDLIVSPDDLSTVSSDISIESESEEKVWDLRDYPIPMKNFRADSWTIEVYDRQRIAGDTLWFRVSRNGTAGYLEYEDKEILGFVERAIAANPDSCYYIKVKFSGCSDDAKVSFFEPRYIPYVLRELLQKAKYNDEIKILYRLDPAFEIKKESNCFLSWLFRFPMFGGSSRVSAFTQL